MGNALDIQLVNGLAGDPAVCVSFAQAGESLLFDAGSLETMTNRELLKVRVVAISHTHVDHFIGFDRLIRVNVPHFRTVEVVGPTGIIENIRGKLAGYLWNLLEPDQVNYLVHEVSNNGAIRSVKISNTSNFEAIPVVPSGSNENSGTPGIAVRVPLLHNGRYRLMATVVDHGTDVLAFCLTMPDTLAVNKEKLAASTFEPGPWIADLQKKASSDGLTGTIEVSGQSIPAADLAKDLLHPRLGESVVYVTDMAFSEANMRSLKSLSQRPVDLVISEANYQSADRDKAQSKKHLTTTQAALIAALLTAKKLQIFHISNVYAGDTETSLRESGEAFETFRLLGSKDLESAASREYVV
jgi:ribonuclease Z